MQSLDSPLSGADEPLVRQVADGGEASLAPMSPPPPPMGAIGAKVRQEWWDESEEEEDYGFGAQLRRQTSFKAPFFGTDVSGRMCQMAYEAAEEAKAAAAAAPAEVEPRVWNRGEAPAGIVTIPCLRADGTRGVTALPCVDGE